LYEALGFTSSPDPTWLIYDGLRSSNPKTRRERHGLPLQLAFSLHLAVFFSGMFACLDVQLFFFLKKWDSSWSNALWHSYDTGTINGILAMVSWWILIFRDFILQSLTGQKQKAWQELFSTGYRNTEGSLDVSPSQESAIVSILSAGTFFGALGSPFLADHIGRNLALIASTWVFNLGVALQTAATDIPLFLAGRFFAGFGVGLISALGR
jgi:MFS family permease